MSVIGACMVPHPPIILPEVGRGEEEKIRATTESFHTAGRFISELRPDTIVISTPHSIMYRDYFHISPGNSAKGDMGIFRAPGVRFNERYDTELVQAICDLAENNGFPAGTEGERDTQLDHGVMVPLYFVEKHIKEFSLVRIGLSGLPLESHFRLGQMVREASEGLGRRVFFLASGDLSHKLKEYGPYGFDPAGSAYDKKIMDVMGKADFKSLFTFDPEMLDSAAECGHRSFCIMAGVLDGLSVTPRWLSHEDIFGVGYGVCLYEVM